VEAQPDPPVGTLLAEPRTKAEDETLLGPKIRHGKNKKNQILTGIGQENESGTTRYEKLISPLQLQQDSYNHEDYYPSFLI
jgi:hypothetical protein